MSNTVDLKLISKYRSAIMGISIIAIMLCHSFIDFHNEFANFAYVLTVNQFMQIGVDIFLLLSGVGCAFSFISNPNVLSFYKKRFVRIVPTYIIICGIYILFNNLYYHIPLKALVSDYSVTSFFTRGILYEWFIAAILVLYLLFPLLFRLTSSDEKKCALFVLILYVISFFVMFFVKDYVPHVINEIFIVRIPIFIIGIFIGKMLKADKGSLKMKNFMPKMIIFTIIGFAIFAVNMNFNSFNSWWFARVLFAPLAVVLSLEIAYIFEHFKCRREKNPLEKFFIFIGGLTLEIYLIHEKMLVYAERLVIKFLGERTLSSVISRILACIAAVFMAYAAKIIISFLTKPISKNNQKKA